MRVKDKDFLGAFFILVVLIIFAGSLLVQRAQSIGDEHRTVTESQVFYLSEDVSDNTVIILDELTLTLQKGDHLQYTVESSDPEGLVIFTLMDDENHTKQEDNRIDIDYLKFEYAEFVRGEFLIAAEGPYHLIVAVDTNNSSLPSMMEVNVEYSLDYDTHEDSNGFFFLIVTCIMCIVTMIVLKTELRGRVSEFTLPNRLKSILVIISIFGLILMVIGELNRLLFHDLELGAFTSMAVVLQAIETIVSIRWVGILLLGSNIFLLYAFTQGFFEETESIFIHMKDYKLTYFFLLLLLFMLFESVWFIIWASDPGYFSHTFWGFDSNIIARGRSGEQWSYWISPILIITTVMFTLSAVNLVSELKERFGKNYLSEAPQIDFIPVLGIFLAVTQTLISRVIFYAFIITWATDFFRKRRWSLNISERWRNLLSNLTVREGCSNRQFWWMISMIVPFLLAWQFWVSPLPPLDSLHSKPNLASTIYMIPLVWSLVLLWNELHSLNALRVQQAITIICFYVAPLVITDISFETLLNNYSVFEFEIFLTGVYFGIFLLQFFLYTFSLKISEGAYLSRIGKVLTPEFIEPYLRVKKDFALIYYLIFPIIFLSVLVPGTLTSLELEWGQTLSSMALQTLVISLVVVFWYVLWVIPATPMYLLTASLGWKKNLTDLFTVIQDYEGDDGVTTALEMYPQLAKHPSWKSHVPDCEEE
jgi:hypothetical protein